MKNKFNDLKPITPFAIIMSIIVFGWVGVLIAGLMLLYNLYAYFPEIGSLFRELIFGVEPEEDKNNDDKNEQ